MSEVAPAPPQSTLAMPLVNFAPSSKYAWVTQPLILAVVTALGYYYAYKFEQGYCGYFHIPEELIKIDGVRIAITVASMVFFFWALAFVFGLYSNDVFKSNLKWYRRVLGVTPVLIFGYFAFRYLKVWIPPFTSGVVLATAIYCDLMQQKRVPNPIFGYLHDFLAARAGFWTVRVLVYCYLMAGVVYSTGNSSAEAQTRFLVPIGNPNMAVVKIYADTVICAKVDFDKKEIYPIFFFYSVNSDFAKGLELKRIKGMQFVDAKES